MKALQKFGAAVALAFASTGASAANIDYYVLESIYYQNNFTGGELDVVGDLGGLCFGCGTAEASVDPFGNVTIGSVGWEITGFTEEFSLQFEATTTLGMGTTLYKNPVTCIILGGSGAGCNGFYTGFGFAVDYTGLASDGTTAVGNTAVDAFIDDFGGPTDYLAVAIRKPLSETNLTLFQEFTLYFLYDRSEEIAVIPVPAAVWLFGSALGLLGWARRRAA